MEHKKQQISCRICGGPLSLMSDTASDENGQPVHSDCYVKHVLATKPDEERFST